MKSSPGPSLRLLKFRRHFDNEASYNVRDFFYAFTVNLKFFRFSCVDIDLAENENIEFVILLFVWQ